MTLNELYQVAPKSHIFVLKDNPQNAGLSCHDYFEYKGGKLLGAREVQTIEGSTSFPMYKNVLVVVLEEEDEE